MYKIILIYLLSLPVMAGESGEDLIKKNLGKLNNFTADSISQFFNGPGTTEVKVRGMEEKRPEYSILLVRPFSVSDTHSFFSQMQLNHYYIRDDGRVAINLGFGYRQIFNNNYILGANIFVDADDEDNTRSSLGLELKTNAFQAYANYYSAISGSNTVGANIERVLDGYDIHAVGQIPFLPWANIHYTYFDWDAEKLLTDTDGSEVSLEMQITKNLLVEVGYSDNNFRSSDGFGSVRFVYPGREGVSAFDKFISESAFASGTVNHLLLSKVERDNKIKIETTSEGVVIGRLD
jgi:hypothetical protein|tara:strand:+ start:136 stop:1011 length:876 start_codon:yes stop_codon:yes gene_type:complete